MFAVRNYQQGAQVLLAACDPEHLDKEYKEGKFRLAVPSNFYDGMRVEEPDLRQFMSSCSVANLVGEKTIGVAIDLGLVDEAHVIHVEGVPHAQMMLL